MNGASILDRFKKDAVVVFIGAHPDDETTIGPLLACAADRCREVVVVSLTRGDGGWNLSKEDLTQTLTQVRDKEFTAAAKILGCTAVTYGYVNGESLAHPQGLAVLELEDAAWQRWQTQGDKGKTAEWAYPRWTAQDGDPADKLLDLLRRTRPTVVIALEPGRGFTNHPEHVTATMATLKAVRAYNRDADAKAVLYYAHNPKDEVAGAERIATADLAARADRDCLQVANESWACYESQFGPRGSDRSRKAIGQGVSQCLLQPVDVE